MTARKINKLFTGDVEAPVDSYPPFPGKEAEYLAAQIARISRGCTMTVNGMWAVEEDEDGNKIIKKKELDGDDPFVPVKSAEGLANAEAWLENWVHHPMYPSILSKMGRCVWPVKEVPEGEDPPDDEEEKEEGEPENKPLTEEAPIGGEGGLAAFSVRLATTALGDYSPAVLRSNRWPGASTIVLDAQVVNIYVGNGLKYEAKPFQLPMPPLLPEECSENMPQEEGS